MSLTRKLLRSMGIEEEKIEQIIDAHTETVDSLKTERDNYKTEAEKVTSLQSTVDSLTAQLDASQKDDWQTKYEALDKEFTDYKSDISSKEVKATKTEAFKKLLIAAGISDKRLDSVVRVSDIDALELDENNELKDKENLTSKVKTEWADFIVSATPQGAKTPTPPTDGTPKSFTKEEISKMSASEINANWDAIKTSLNQ